MASGGECERSFLWERGELLGSGEFGVVCFGLLKAGRVRLPVAVKSAVGSSAIDLRLEKELLDHLAGCPQIIRCYGDVTTEEEEKGLGETYNIFLEYAPKGSLRSYLKLRPMRELHARRLVRSMLRGLVHMHSRGVAHCDIKPDNVLLWSREEVKIIDFGVSLRTSEKSLEPSLIRGTPYYMAPECIARNDYGPSGDVWALGCTFAEMLTGEPARAYMDNVDFKDLLFYIGNGLAPPEMPKRMSALGKDFLSRCFEVEAEKRWTAEMLLKHPYMDGLDTRRSSAGIVSKVFRRLPVIGSCIRCQHSSA